MKIHWNPLYMYLAIIVVHEAVFASYVSSKTLWAFCYPIFCVHSYQGIPNQIFDENLFYAYLTTIAVHEIIFFIKHIFKQFLGFVCSPTFYIFVCWDIYNHNIQRKYILFLSCDYYNPWNYFYIMHILK